jgi:hypothetical protein
MKNPGTAAVLSFFIPGVGQIYNGEFLRGLFWLIVTASPRRPRRSCSSPVRRSPASCRTT